jgi:hypothetical protein
VPLILAPAGGTLFLWRVLGAFGPYLRPSDHDHDMWFLTCVPNFSSLAWLEVCQEPPVLEVHTWRTLSVPDWILREWDHSWHLEWSWYVILDLCAKFQLSSLIRSVSKTDWLETWKLGSFLTSWIILGDPQEVILKVLKDLTSFDWDIEVCHICDKT